jgi:hypothetical protein
MTDINLAKQNLPFLLGGDGNLTIHANVPSVTEPLPVSDNDILSIDFGAQGNQSFTFGVAGGITLGIQAGVSSHLYALWPSSSRDRASILADHGLSDFFATRHDQLVLVFVLEANAAANIAGSFRYSALTANISLDAGGSVGYAYLHPYPANTPADKMFTDFIGSIRLPANLSSDLPVGEVIAFDFGGYLKFGASLSVGYEMKGAPDFSIGQLQLSEHYQYSVAGTLGINAQLAGQFSVEARAAVDDHQLPKPNWIRVMVQKKRSTSFQIAADAGVTATSDLQGLPDSADEFLGALLGTRVKNWLNMIAKIRELSDLNALKAELDDLGKQFVQEWIGKAFDALSQTEFADFLGQVQKVVDSYQNLDNSAITLFDRYFSKLDLLTAQLNKLAALTSWNDVKGPVDGELWQVLQQLTGGDPLGWILGKIEKKDSNGNLTPVPSLTELQARVQQTLDLIKSDAHDEIRKVIAVAKSKFPLDGFIQQLSQIDSIAKLKGLADEKAEAFLERLLGTTIDQLKNSELGKSFNRLHQALAAISSFETSVYAKFKDAVQQSLTFNLHAEYNRASESDALIDVEINISTPLGKSLLQAAGRGDFQDVLASFQPDVVHLNEGTLTHKVTRSSALAVNVLGWHAGWHYQGMDSVITQTDQQIVTGKNGGLSVYSTVTLNKDRVRQRQDQKTMTNLLFRFIGESHRVLKFDPANQEYLIDAISAASAAYTLSFSDQVTSRNQVQYYLSFADSFGLATQGATLQNLLPLLPLPDPKKDDYGPIQVDYEVRFTDEGLRRLFAAPFDMDKIRRILRTIVLASYLRDSGLTSLGWCYWTQGIYDLWSAGQSAFTHQTVAQQFSPIQESPFDQFPAPSKVTLQPPQIVVLGTLFSIEDDFVNGIEALDSMIHQNEIAPSQFERNLAGVGDALGQIDGFDESVNGVFAILDQLVRSQTPTAEARLSSLTLKSMVGNQQVTKVFLSGLSA